MYPLTISHLTLAFEEWKRCLKEGDHVIDATCGRGKDTLRLAQIVGLKGSVIGIDVQEDALKTTRSYLTAHLPEDHLDQITLFHQSHTQFPQAAYKRPISLIVYNLGYLPQGDQSVTTQVESTLRSIKEAMRLIQPGGLISITCYPGHPEGKQEETALLEMVSELPTTLWETRFHKKLDSTTAPSVLFIKKIIES